MPTFSNQPYRRWIALLLVGLLLTACGGAAADTTPPGNPQRGQLLFDGVLAPLASGSTPTCNSCHAVTPEGDASIGTNLSNIGNRADKTVPGQTARDYLREAIIEPDKYLAGGFQEGIHFRGYGQVLSQQDIDDLIAYMLTLKSGVD